MSPGARNYEMSPPLALRRWASCCLRMNALPDHTDHGLEAKLKVLKDPRY